MTDDEKEWLTNNRDTFFETNIPALQILDFLVTAKVFRPTSDDYQVIVAQTTLVEQIRKLLDALPSKSSAAFQVFSEALKSIVHTFSTHVPTGRQKFSKNLMKSCDHTFEQSTRKN